MKEVGAAPEILKGSPKYYGGMARARSAAGGRDSALKTESDPDSLGITIV